VAPILNLILWQNESMFGVTDPIAISLRRRRNDNLVYRHEIRRSPVKFLWLTIYLAGLLWSAANPHDYFTWILEAFSALNPKHSEITNRLSQPRPSRLNDEAKFPAR